MQGQAGRNGGVSTDLLVCFPSRAPLTLMPKLPIRSPSRTTDAGKRCCPARPGTRVPASPLFKNEPKSRASEIAEPTSPKVTCSGQVKTRCGKSRSGESKNWLSVVEEIEKLHRQRKRRPHWLGAPCLKKDAMQFVASLRGFGLACFCSLIQGPVDGTTDGEDNIENKESKEKVVEAISTVSKTTSSKCLLQLLEENRGVAGNCDGRANEEERDEQQPIAQPPPPNALLLMRCRSAPAKGRTVSETIKKEEEKDELLPPTGYGTVFPEMENLVVERSSPFTRSRSWRR